MTDTYLSESRSDNKLLSDRLLSDEVRELYKEYPQHEWDLLVDKIAKLEQELRDAILLNLTTPTK